MKVTREHECHVIQSQKSTEIGIQKFDDVPGRIVILRRYPMNKDKLIQWLKSEIEKLQGGGILDSTREDELQKVLRHIQSEPEETCTYSHDEDTDAWICNKCNNTWVFMESTTPEENDMYYCPKCGRKIAEKAGE